MKEYPNLFSELKIGKRIARNRIVLSPMGDNMANTDGSVSDQSLAYYTERAKGGAGIIIAGVVCVDYPVGKTIPCQHRLDDIKYIAGWSRMAQSVHRYDSLLLAQLQHAGQSTDKLTTEGVTPLRVSDDPNAAMQVGSKLEGFTPDEYRTMTIEDFKDIEQKFINSAVYAQRAGLDGVEIHGITYLVAQTYTSFYNHRTDEYGGSMENKCRFAYNIISGIRKACGVDFIIGIRMPIHNPLWNTDGFTEEESIYMVKRFVEAGCDFIDAVPGLPPRFTALIGTGRYEQGDRAHLPAMVKQHVDVPVFVNGNLREPQVCEKILAEGKADGVILGRALLADPYFPEKARTGRTCEIRRCIACLDGCYGSLTPGRPITCVLNPTCGFEYQLKLEPEAKEKKKIVVVGGGISGMQAAITAKDRGHDVVLLEATDKLGGQMNLACVPPHKQLIKWAIEWFTGEVERKGVEVRLNAKADIDTIKSLGADHVILAAGSRPWSPSIEGIEGGVEAWNILNGNVEMPTGKNIAMIGGGTVGCETALMLAENGNTVKIIEMLDHLCTGLELANKMDLMEDLQNNNVEIILNARVEKICADKVVYSTAEGEKSADANCVVLSLGQRSEGKDVAAALDEAGISYKVVGDAKRPGKFINATTTGFYAALDA